MYVIISKNNDVCTILGVSEPMDQHDFNRLFVRNVRDITAT